MYLQNGFYRLYDKNNNDNESSFWISNMQLYNIKGIFKNLLYENYDIENSINIIRLNSLFNHMNYFIKLENNLTIRKDQWECIKHNLLILSVDQVQNFIPSQIYWHNAVLIRIQGKREYTFTKLPNESYYDDKIELIFDDIQTNNSDDSTIIFTKNIALNLSLFIEKNLLKPFVIHCHAGISRSSAVALVIATILNKEKIFEYIINSNIYSPNEYVYNLLISTFIEYLENINNYILNKRLVA